MDSAEDEGVRQYVTYVWGARKDVWTNITTGERNEKWYMPAHKFSTRKRGLVEWGAGGTPAVTGRVAACNKRVGFFAHTFRFAFLDEPEGLVRWRITQMGKVVQVWLRHELGGRPQTESIVSGSWNVILARLKTLAETGNVMPEPQWPTKEGWDADPA